MDANNIIVASPSIGVPVLYQQRPEPVSLVVTSPSFGTPAILQKHNLTARNKTVLSPEIYASYVRQTQILPPAGMTVAAPSIGISAINHELLSSAGLTVAAATVGTATFRQKHGLAAIGFTISTPSFGVPRVHYNLTATNLIVTSPAFGAVDVVPTWYSHLHWGHKVLYRSATSLEKALADVESDVLLGTTIEPVGDTGLRAELIIETWDPFKTQLRNLPVLAWAWGVNIWVDGWHEVTKRTWTAKQYDWKAKRGTVEAISTAVDYVGRDTTPFGYAVTGVTAPPQQVFSGPSLTKAEREAWLALLPQVRVWRIHESWNAPTWKSFYGGHTSLRLTDARFCLRGPSSSDYYAYTTPSTAITRLKRRARWIESGVETEVKVTEFGNYFRLHKSGVEDHAVFCDRIAYDRYYVPSTAWRRLITIQPRMQLPWRSAVTPARSTLQAIVSEPERVVVSGTRGYSVICDQVMGLPSYYVPTTAPYRIYDRYPVLDNVAMPTHRSPVQFMGVGRYGWPKYTAWLDVRASGKLPSWAAGFGYHTNHKYWVPHDYTRVVAVRQAVWAAKSLRDKMLLRLGPKRRFIASETPVLADLDEVIIGRL